MALSIGNTAQRVFEEFKKDLSKVLGIEITTMERVTLPDSGVDTHAIRLKDKDRLISFGFEVGQLHSCCGICVVANHVFGSAQYFEGDKAKILMKFQEAIASAGGYTVMLATKQSYYQANQIKWLEQAGFKAVDKFTNSRTKVDLVTLIKHI